MTIKQQTIDCKLRWLKKDWFLAIVILILCVNSNFAQQKVISGSVTTATDSQPLPGVNVGLLPLLGRKT